MLATTGDASRDGYARASATQHTSDELVRTAKLCLEHKRLALAWRDHFYRPHQPSDWPMRGRGILDDRTTHGERALDWTTKNLGQIRLTVAVCQSGRSTQCTRNPEVGP